MFFRNTSKITTLLVSMSQVKITFPVSTLLFLNKKNIFLDLIDHLIPQNSFLHLSKFADESFFFLIGIHPMQG